MISIELFLCMLLVASVLTGLFTEAIKKVLEERKANYYANTLAGIVSVIVSAAVGAAYTVMMEAQINAKLAVMLVALMFMSWLSAMVGYDKVMQAITQFQIYKKGE